MLLLQLVSGKVAPTLSAIVTALGDSSTVIVIGDDITSSVEVTHFESDVNPTSTVIVEVGVNVYSLDPLLCNPSGLPASVMSLKL